MLITPQKLSLNSSRPRVGSSRAEYHLCQPEDSCIECQEYWIKVTKNGLWNPELKDWNWDRLKPQGDSPTLASLRPLKPAGKSWEMMELEQRFGQAKNGS